MFMVVLCDTKIAKAHSFESDVSPGLHGKAELSTPRANEVWESVRQINVQTLSHKTRCME